MVRGVLEFSPHIRTQRAVDQGKAGTYGREGGLYDKTSNPSCELEMYLFLSELRTSTQSGMVIREVRLGRKTRSPAGTF